MADRRLNILVVGGGAAGVTVATGLSKSLDPTRFSLQLVTERRFNVHLPALTRLFVTGEGSLETKALNPYNKIFAPGKAGEVIYGSVAKIEDGVAHLSDGQRLSYDWLVLATGTKWAGPLMFPNEDDKRQAWIDSWRQKIASANNIVLIGGGPVGIEVAGEIRHFHPSKRVTIVHAGQHLLNDRYPEKFRLAVDTKAKKAGIRLVLGDRLQVPEGSFTSVTTEKGHTLDADLVIPFWGGQPNTDFLRSFDDSILTSSGYVRVLPTLRVPLKSGKTNVYAIGDIIDWPEEKKLAKVPTQAGVVVANLLANTKGHAGTKEYGGFMEAIMMPLGPKGGIGWIPILWGITAGDWLTWLMKSRTLFVWMAQKMMNVQ